MKKHKVKAQGKVVGYVEGAAFFKMASSNHFLQKPPAIAFDVASLQTAQQFGALYVCVTDRSNGRQYCAAISKIEREGFRFNRGYGDQIGLLLTKFASDLMSVTAEQRSFWDKEAR